MAFNGLIKFLNSLIDALASIANIFLGWLPDSPFLDLDIHLPFVDNLGWLIDFSFIVRVTGIWLVAIAAYYVCSTVLRWLKVIS